MPAIEDPRAQGSGCARDVPRALRRAGSHVVLGGRKQLSASSRRGQPPDSTQLSWWPASG